MNYLVPIPKKIIYKNKTKEDFLEVSSLETIDFTIFFDERLETLTDIITSTYEKNKRNGLITFKYKNLKKEAYKLVIKKRKVDIFASSVHGIYYGLITLKQLASKYNGLIPYLEIYDEPDIEVRGFHFDISRNKVSSVKTICELIDLLSLLKYNQLQLYVEGFSFEYQSMPFVNKDNNYISVLEYKQIEKYANDHFIDLVPNQNGFGHMGDWLKLDEFKHLSNIDGLFDIWGSKRYPTTLDPTNIDSYNLVKKMYDDMLPHSNSMYFNMNFDEPYELGYGKSKELCDKIGKEKVYTNYFNSLAKVVKDYNKIPLLWGDVIIKCEDAIKDIDRDAILIDWGYTDDYNFSEHARRLKKLKRKYMLAPGTSTWACITSKIEDAMGSIENACEAAIKYDAQGVLLTDWGDFGHLQYFIYSIPSIIYCGYLMWNYEASSKHLVKESLNDILNSEMLASIVIELSRYYLNEDHYLGYSTKLFLPISTSVLVQTQKNPLEEFKTKMFNRLLTDEEILKHELHLHKIKALIDTLSFDNTFHYEVLNSWILLDVMKDVHIFLKGCKENKIDEVLYESITYKLNKYRKNHYDLWSIRNKIEGYKFSIQTIDYLLDCLESLKKEAKQNET